MRLRPLSLPFFFALLALSFLFSGCALFREKPITVVNDSQLNWITVKYRPANPSENPCYLNIIGVGSVAFKEGHSPLVFDPFSQDVSNPKWGDIQEEKLGVTPEQARWMMQLLVDAGLTTENNRLKRLPSKKSAPDSSERGIALFSAKLNNKPCRVATNNPEILDVLEKIISSIRTNRGFH